MEAIFQYLKANPFLLLFLTVGLAVWVGRFSVKGYGLGMVAAAIVVGVALATWASVYGVKLQLDNFAKSLMYYLFMYGVGLRVGPSFFNSLKKDGVTFTILAVICAVLGLVLVVVLSRLFGLPAGRGGAESSPAPRPCRRPSARRRWPSPRERTRYRRDPPPKG